MDPTVRFATTADGVRVAWASVGSGPALVHLPGVPFSNLEAEWRIPVLRRAFERMAARIRFVQFDGRGTGRSQRDPVDLSFDAHLRDLDAVLADAGIRRAVLLGFYHSATHAIAWAERHPERVAGLILFGGSTRGWSPMSGAGTQALLSLIERDWDTFVESATHAWLGWPSDDEGRLAADWFRTSTSPAIARETMRVASGVDVTAEAGRLSCPVLILHRRDASVIPLVTSEELAAAIPGARLEILPGHSASLFFEATDAIADLLVAFTLNPGAGEEISVPSRPASDGLSPRELEVLRLLASGASNGRIAADLGLSINTVERHVTNVYRKLDVGSRAEATALAIRRGLA
jgi:pimeloyl-ACP methyl ester carboxylesterase/DNA-binding CsgD family transcriptional regulator